GLGVVAGKAEVGIDGRRQFVDSVTRRQSDFEAVRILYRCFELNWKPAWLFGFQYSPRLASEDARSYQEEVAGVLGIVIGLECVVEAKGLIAEIEVHDRRLRDSEVRE